MGTIRYGVLSLVLGSLGALSGIVATPDNVGSVTAGIYTIGIGLLAALAFIGLLFIAFWIRAPFAQKREIKEFFEYKEKPFLSERLQRYYREKYIEPEGLDLLRWLDEFYQRQKLITKDTIQQLRKKGWRDMEEAIVDLMELSGMDVTKEIIEVVRNNLILFMCRLPLTFEKDTIDLTKRFKGSSLFTRNPEDLAGDSSIILANRVPYLKKRIESDYVYGEIQKEIRRARDNFPDESVNKAAGEFIEHSTKINAVWLISQRDLDSLPLLDKIKKIPLSFKLLLMAMPGRMDEEMDNHRTKVAKSISDYQKRGAK